MYEVIYMKADYEPWWMFDGWEEDIQEVFKFPTKEEADQYLKRLMQEFRMKYPHEKIGKECFYAFWTDEEQYFCDACDDALQIFHGLFITYEGKPIV